ncbi:MAG: hypothetical protein PHV28_13970, partial [Kiritimatiellae bacterium]|nr:hypothetical protein [Kiritimatiellia bacterium]
EAHIASSGTARNEAEGAKAKMVELLGSVNTGLYVGPGGTLSVSKRLDLHPSSGYTAVALFGGGTSDLSGIWTFGAGGFSLIDVTGGVVNVKGGPYIAYTLGSRSTIRQSGGLINLFSNSMKLCGDARSVGRIELSGNGVFTNLNALYLTYGKSGGDASVSLTNDASMSVAALYAGGDGTNSVYATGTVAVCGGVLAATAASIGYYGVGDCTLKGGAIRSTTLIVGENSAATGTLAVSGGTFDATTVNIARSGRGSCTLADGQIRCTTFSVGENSSATGTLAVSGGTLAAATVNIGKSGRGDGTLTDGQIRCTAFNVGESSSGTGTLAVSGGTLDASTVTIGKSGQGGGTLSGGMLLCTNLVVADQSAARSALQVGAGATLRAVEDVIIAKIAGADGHIQQDGGAINIRNLYLCYVSAPSNSSYTLNGGTLRVRNAMTGLATNGNETFTFTGGSLSVLTYMNTMPALVNAGGTLAPGLDVAGKCTVDTNYAETSAAARLSIDVGGTSQASAFTNAPGYYDFVNVTGSATLAGELKVNLINGSEASIKHTDKFYVLESGSDIAGAFANVASGGRVTTTNRHSFAVYYGNNAATAAAGESAKKVTLTDFRVAPKGTILTLD